MIFFDISVKFVQKISKFVQFFIGVCTFVSQNVKISSNGTKKIIVVNRKALFVSNKMNIKNYTKI